MKRFDALFFRLQEILLTQDSIKDRKPPHRVITIILLSIAYTVVLGKVLYIFTR